MVALRTWFRRPGLQDACLGLALIGATVILNDPATFVGKLPNQPIEDAGNAAPDMLAVWWIASLFAVAGVTLRRRWPIPMLVLCAMTAGVHLVLQAPIVIIDLATPILLYTVATRYRRAISLGFLVALVAVTAGGAFIVLADFAPRDIGGAIQGMTEVRMTQPVGLDPPIRPDPPEPVMDVKQVVPDLRTGLPLLGSILVASWAFGSSTRNRRAYLDELHARTRDLERERDQQAALATAAERGRITRELHDVVAHGLSVMVVQAQGGAAALEKRPWDTRDALASIIDIGRGSLADMRRSLAAVGPVDPADGALHPQPGLGRLPNLVEEVRRAGTPVQLHIEGDPATLPAAVDLSAYRIVQEALTNTMKHAGPDARAQVLLAYDPDDLHIEVSDDGRSASTPEAGGNGLRGMRERADLLGGELTAGPGPRGGFVVRARLPLEGRPA